MEKKLWNYLVYAYFAAISLGVIALVEVLLYRIPYVSIFLLIFGFVFLEIRDRILNS